MLIETPSQILEIDGLGKGLLVSFSRVRVTGSAIPTPTPDSMDLHNRAGYVGINLSIYSHYIGTENGTPSRVQILGGVAHGDGFTTFYVFQ